MKKITAALFVSLLSGCASQNLPNSITPSIHAGSDDASTKLAEAASSVSQSLNELKELEKASSSPISKPLPYPSASGLEKTIVSVDWSGPIEPLLRRVAKLIQFHLEIIGKHPAVPVLVTISSQNTSLSYILRDANLQSGKKANILVYPGIKIIELRYAKY
jgi:defect-in-organelle-trafficking protein DotD